MTTQVEQTQKLKLLVDKIDNFVNGSADSTIATNSGSLKSLSGLSKQISTINFVAKVRDFGSLSELLANEDELEEGSISRVLLDVNPLNRGYYQKEPLEIVKISYADLFDLHDRFPDPYNKTIIELDETDTIGPVNILKITIPPSVAFLEGTSFGGRLEFTTQNTAALFAPSNAFFYSATYAFAVSGLQAGVQHSGYTKTNEITLGTAESVTVPTLSATHAVEDGNNVFTVRFNPGVPGKLKLILENYDTRKVAVI